MSKIKKIFRRILLLLSIISIVSIAIKSYDALSQPLFDTGVNETVSPIEGIDDVDDKGPFNVLLVGADASGELADAIMLVNVDKTQKTIRMLSIPRDTKVKVDGKKCKINSCLRKGGLHLLISTVKELTEAPINYYALIEPGTLAAIVDSLGGVEYEVEQDMHYSDPTQDLYIDLKAGLQTLNGEQAEQYCRYRSYAMGDIERTRCQQKFFKALFEQKLNFKYVPRLASLYSAVSEKVITNITLRDITDNISVMRMITDESQIKTIETPGAFNDVKKDRISYYLIEGDDLEKLRIICSDYFNGNFRQ